MIDFLVLHTISNSVFSPFRKGLYQELTHSSFYDLTSLLHLSFIRNCNDVFLMKQLMAPSQNWNTHAKTTNRSPKRN